MIDSDPRPRTQPVSKELSRAINERVILRLAGEQVRRRGEDYYLHGHVESVAGDESAVVVTVRDKHRHTVRLSAEEGILDYSCGCPAGVKGSFCMQWVAAGVALLCFAT